MAREARDRLASVIALVSAGDMRALYDELMALYRPADLAEVYTDAFYAETATFPRETLAGDPSGTTVLGQVLSMQYRRWLPANITLRQDRLCMAHGVENRVPFLDHRLAEFAARLPVSYKIRGGETKYLLKKLMEPYLPRDVIYRTKKGFPVPIAAWFRNGLYYLAGEMLLSPHAKIRTYLKQDSIGKMLQWHKSGTLDLSNELWGLLILEYWMKEFQVQS